MEKNNKGSITVESFFIIPILLIFIMVFIIILMVTYEKTVNIISVHQSLTSSDVHEFKILKKTNIVTDERSIKTTDKYKLNKEEIEVSYEYKKKSLNVKDVQKLIEYLLYLVNEYKERLMEIKNVKKL